MNEWEIKYVYDGNHNDVILADTLELAVAKWRKEHLDVPSLALYSVVCLK